MAKKGSKGIIQAYTDGSYDWDRKVGGYGAVIFMTIVGVRRMRRLSSTKSYLDTTSNRMEIRAILAVLDRISHGYTIDIYSDSTYCVNMINKIKSQPYHRPEANKDLWNKIKKSVNAHLDNNSKINVSWIRGHSGNTFNEMADKLAYEGSMKEKKTVCDQSKSFKKERASR